MENNNNQNTNPLKVSVAKTKKEGLQQPDCCPDILPKIHCSYLNVGRSGSGKSNVIIHMLNSPQMLKGVFNKIYYFIASVDETFCDNVKCEQIEMGTSKQIQAIDKIEDIIESQKKNIDKLGFKEASRKHNTLMVFDDILSVPKVLRSDILLKLVTECRHYLVSCIFNSQSYTKIPRSIRINCRGIIFFPASLGEIERLADEQSLPNMTKKQFKILIQHATKEPYNFAFLNLDAKPSERLRKNFDTILG